ncbi:MAG: four-carbon acid sugar kinase family protein, partial [Planctomycetota bacterium]|nr:four-carbon acid sugar kinase family protein [Planctomycetota bacterium]
MDSLAVIADDFTGAGDSGVHFAAAGLKTVLLLEHASLDASLAGGGVAVMSTESRLMPPGRAAEAVRKAVRHCRRCGIERFYKKMDSTLRGNPGAETEAALAESGCEAALVCPAMPRTGRVVRDGRLFVHGLPLEETDAGRDPFNPVPGSRLQEIFAAQTGLPAGRLPLESCRSGAGELLKTVRRLIRSGRRLILADAENNSDLRRLGRLFRRAAGGESGREEAPRLLPVGAGGLAEAMAERTSVRPSGLGFGRLLAIIGSLTRISREQAEYAV